MLLADPLLDLAGLDDDHLVLFRVLVEVVPEAGLERDVHHDERLAAGVRRPRAPADVAPVEVVDRDLGLFDEGAHRVLLRG